MTASAGRQLVAEVSADDMVDGGKPGMISAQAIRNAFKLRPNVAINSLEENWGIPRSTINAILKGKWKSVSPETATKILEGLGVDPIEIGI